MTWTFLFSSFEIQCLKKVPCWMSFFKENLICDQTTYECIIWYEMQTTLKTEQAPISIAKPFFHVRSHTLASKCPEHVECALSPPHPICRAPAIRRLRVFLYVIQILHLSDFVPARQTWYHKRVRYYIHMLNHYAKTQLMTSYKNAQPWRILHLWWFNVCLFDFFIYLIEGPCMRLDYINQSYCQRGNISVFLWMFWKKNKNQWQCLELWKNEICIHHNPKAKNPGIK